MGSLGGAGRVLAIADSEGLLVGLGGCGSGAADRSAYLRLPGGVGFERCDLRGQQAVVDAVTKENQRTCQPCPSCTVGLFDVG